jgi:signal transduction histidine kinase
LIVAVALRPIDLSVEGALVQVALYVGGWVIGTGVRERREMEAVRRSEGQRELELAHRQAELERERASRATAEERLRITRELHDVLGHAFSVMVVQAGAAEQLIDADPAAVRAALREIGATGRSSLADIRRVLGQLRDGEGHPGLEPSPSLADLPALVARVEAAGLPTRLRLEADPNSSQAGVEVAAYRVIQEALTNCLKHASAAHAYVVVGLVDQGSDNGASAALQIDVWDDGVGAVAGAEQDGHGLSGMRERVSVYGGTLSAGPASDGGYRVSARIPLVAEHKAGVA